MLRRTTLAMAVSWVGGVLGNAVESSDLRPANVPRFVAVHCLDCHGRDGHAAGLTLEDLPFAADHVDDARLWEAVHDRVSRGEMPPADAEQPAMADKAAFLAAVRDGLRQAGLARQAREGRGPVRRLTRAEYENTINDLLGIHVDVKDLFPDDSATSGFDKVGEGLAFSAAHLEAYQAAADKALAEAMPEKRQGPLRFAADGPELFKRKAAIFADYGNWLEDDAFVVTSRLFYPYTAITSPWVPRGGRYRVSVTAQARQSDGRQLPIGFGAHSHWFYKPDAPDLMDWRDIPADAWRTVTVELDLTREQTVHVFGVTLKHRDLVIPQSRRGERWEKEAIAIRRFEVEGPLTEDGSLDAWPPRSCHVLFDDLPFEPLSKVTGKPPAAGVPDPWIPVSTQPRQDAERLLRRFLPRAFRRPVPDAIVAEYVDPVHRQLDAGVPFHKAMRSVYKAVLCSPHFLLLDASPGPLDPYAIASRLSFFLWDGPPDDALLAAADRGDLARAEGRREAVERMLADRKSARFERSFTDQWLDLGRIDATSPDEKLYPEFDDALRLSCLQETRLYFHDLLARDRSLLEGIHSDWTYLNGPLAALYGLPETAGHELRKETLAPGSHRGGFLTQASILKVTADGAKTSPVLRGKWVTERILGLVPPPPPDDIPKIEPDIRGATTIREQLAKHRSAAACAGCHRVIDPPGFALESFDVIGGWRDHYRVPHATNAVIEIPRIKRRVHRGPAVEAGYTMPDGKRFADIDEYKRIVLEDKDALAFALASKLLAYATGAPVQFADRADVAAVVANIRERQYGLRSLVHAVVESRPFLHK